MKETQTGSSEIEKIQWDLQKENAELEKELLEAKDEIEDLREQILELHIALEEARETLLGVATDIKKIPMIPQHHRDDTIVKFACRFCCQDSYKRADEGVSLCYSCYKNCKHERYVTSDGSQIKYIKNGDTPFVQRCEDCGEDITNLRLKRI